MGASEGNAMANGMGCGCMPCGCCGCPGCCGGCCGCPCGGMMMPMMPMMPSPMMPMMNPMMGLMAGMASMASMAKAAKDQPARTDAPPRPTWGDPVHPPACFGRHPPSSRARLLRSVARPTPRAAPARDRRRRSRQSLRRRKNPKRPLLRWKPSIRRPETSLTTSLISLWPLSFLVRASFGLWASLGCSRTCKKSHCLGLTWREELQKRLLIAQSEAVQDLAGQSAVQQLNPNLMRR